MYTRIRKFFFRQKPFECKFTLEGIIMYFSKVALFAVAAYDFSLAGITGNVVDESGTPVHNAAVTIRTLPNLLASARTLTNDKGTFKLGSAKKDQSIIVRKAGFLPETLSMVAGQKKYENITLKRDPIENKIDEIMAKMTIDDMIAQMTQAKVPMLKCGEGAGVADVLFGKVKPTGKLPHTWPKDAKQIPINKDDGKKGLFPYGYGLTY